MRASASQRVLSRAHALVDAMRRHGAGTSVAEVADLSRALVLLGADAFATSDQLYAACATTLAKSARDEEALARVFPLVFGFSFANTPALSSFVDLLERRGVPRAQAQRLSDALCEQIDPDDDALHRELLAALLAGDVERVTALLRDALDALDLEGLSSSLQVSYFAGRLLARIGAERLSRLAEDVDAPLDASTRQALEGALVEDAEALRRTARRAIEDALARRVPPRAARGGSIADRDLFTLDAADLLQMRRVAHELARRIRSRIAQRRRRARRGRLDARRTLRGSGATDGVLFRPHMRRRRPDRPELVVLCDVSDSVRRASLFMLELVAALADAMPRTRSFVFVDSLVDVTALFRLRPATATAEVLDGTVVNLSANSDYGRALRELWARERAHLGRKTTVIILGDGRSNYRAPDEHILLWVKRRVRRVVWLCPEGRATWGFGDSEMTRFARYADAIPGQRSARDLAAALDRIAR